MKILVVVQARTGSSRFPRKILQKVFGKTLLELQIERIQHSLFSNNLIVATTENQDDDVICQICSKLNIENFRVSENDLLDRHYQISKLMNADAVVKIPSDCPLIDPNIIDKVIRTFIDNYPAFDYVSNLHPPTYPDGNDVEIMKFEILEEAWKYAEKSYEREHTTSFIWDSYGKYNISNYVWESGLDYSMTHRFTIDYPEDYLFIKTVYEKLYPTNKIFSLDDILNLLDNEPEIYRINNKYAGYNWYRNHLDDLKTITQNMTIKL